MPSRACIHRVSHGGLAAGNPCSANVRPSPPGTGRAAAPEWLWCEGAGRAIPWKGPANPLPDPPAAFSGPGLARPDGA